jgi:hypothetical protein
LELAEAELILGLCKRFNCLPSQIMNESADLLRLIAIEAEGTPEPTYSEDDYYEE